MAFHEREYAQVGVLATGGADGSIMLRTWGVRGVGKGWEWSVLREVKVRTGEGGMRRGVSAVRFIG